MEPLSSVSMSYPRGPISDTGAFIPSKIAERATYRFRMWIRWLKARVVCRRSANKPYESGESGMGDTIFTVVFADGSCQAIRYRRRCRFRSLSRGEGAERCG